MHDCIVLPRFEPMHAASRPGRIPCGLMVPRAEARRMAGTRIPRGRNRHRSDATGRTITEQVPELAELAKPCRATVRARRRVPHSIAEYPYLYLHTR